MLLRTGDNCACMCAIPSFDFDLSFLVIFCDVVMLFIVKTPNTTTILFEMFANKNLTVVGEGKPAV